MVAFPSSSLTYLWVPCSLPPKYKNSLDVITDSELFQNARINFFLTNSSTKNKKAIIKDGKVSYIPKNSKIPDGWKRGGKEASNKGKPLTKEHIQKIKIANTGKKYYYDPKTYKTIVCKENEQPEGWIPGFTPAHKKAFKKRPESKYKGTKYYHSPDGKNIIRCFENEVPENYLPGRGKNFVIKKKDSSATHNKVRYQNPETKEFKFFYKGKQPEGWILSTYQQELASRKSRYFYDPITHKEKRIKYGKSPPEGWIPGRYCYLRKGFNTGSKIVNTKHVYRRVKGDENYG